MRAAPTASSGSATSASADSAWSRRAGRRRRTSTWSLFESGPALTEALKAGSIDIGQVGEAPPVFAAAGKIPFSDHRHLGSRSPRARPSWSRPSKGYRSFADLKGKKVALNKGSNVQLAARAAARGERHDAQGHRGASTSSPPTAGPRSTTARSTPGSSGTRTSPWPSTPGVQVLADATGLASNREYLLASPRALKTSRTRSASSSRRYREVTDWGIANPDERASILAPELNIPRGRRHAAPWPAAPSPSPRSTPAIGDELQPIADSFIELKLIPGQVDIKGRVDGRFTRCSSEPYDAAEAPAAVPAAAPPRPAASAAGAGGGGGR